MEESKFCLLQVALTIFFIIVSLGIVLSSNPLLLISCLTGCPNASITWTWFVFAFYLFMLVLFLLDLYKNLNGYFEER